MINFNFGDLWWGPPLAGGLLIFILIILAFEVWMLVDVVQNRKVPMNQKIWWVVGMFLLHPFVAMAYFIVSRWTSTYK